MPAFTIFIDQWPWIIAYLMISVGAYMLILGNKHFKRVQRIFFSLLFFCVVSCCLSIGGHFEEKISVGPSGSTLFLIIILSILGVVAGYFAGHFIPNKYGLIVMCVCNACVISMLLFSFLITFTGTWVVLIVIMSFLILVCIYLPVKFQKMMQI